MCPVRHFRVRHRLTHAREYQAVFGERVARARGPLTVFLRPNRLPEHRLGLSIGKRVGNATVRVRLKRQIREAFRIDRPVYPYTDSGLAYDIVVSARRHKPLSQQAYRDILSDAIDAAHREIKKRDVRTTGPVHERSAP